MTICIKLNRFTEQATRTTGEASNRVRLLVGRQSYIRGVGSKGNDTPFVDGCRESEFSLRVVQRQDVDHGGVGGAWRLRLTGDETANTFLDGSAPVEREGSMTGE